MVGMSGASLSNYENGISKIPDEVVLKICEVLKVDEGVFSDSDNIERYCSFVPTKVDYESIRERVRRLRKESGMTREEFANYCGCSFGILVKIEHNNTNPSDTVLETIADGADVGFGWLKYGDERLRKSPVNKKLISWLEDNQSVRDALWEKMEETS